MLTVSNLTAGYGVPNILQGLDITVRPGEMVGLVGANGAGKTTLVRVLAGLLPARGGSITINGLDTTNVPAHARPKLGLAIVLENRNLFGELTVAENLRLAERAGANRPKKFDIPRIVEMFPAVGEKMAVRCDLLSGGQQQMVAIARALLLQPDVVIMDEPSTGLAPKVVKAILEVLRGLCSEGMSIVLIEQNIGIASSVTQRAYVLSTGRIVHHVADGGWPAFLHDPHLVSRYLGQH